MKRTKKTKLSMERKSKTHKISKVSIYKILFLTLILFITSTSPFWHIFFEKGVDDGVFGFRSMRSFLYTFGTHFILFGISVFMFWILQLIPNLNDKIKRVKIIGNTGVIIYCSVSIYYLLYVFVDTSNPYPDYYYEVAFVFTSLAISLLIYFYTKYNKTTIQRLEEDNQKAQSTIKQLEKEVLTKQEKEREEERQRISEELHDSVLGKLFGTRMGLGFLDLSNDLSKEKYQKFLNELQEVEKEIREVSHRLSANLDGTDIGLDGIIEQLLKDKSVINNLSYSLDIDKSIEWLLINEVDHLNLYRIVQEALQNIIKHAKAKNIEVRITKQNQIIRVAIKDDGIGFNSFKSKNGIGIKNIKSRVKRLKGSMQIHSEPNRGTTLNIYFPYMAKIMVQM